MSSLGAKFLTGSVLTVIGLVTVKVVFGLLFGFMALMGFLLFKVLPIALVVWLIMKLLKSSRSDKPAYE